jgi:hypothetical protein
VVVEVEGVTAVPHYLLVVVSFQIAPTPCVHVHLLIVAHRMV